VAAVLPTPTGNPLTVALGKAALYINLPDWTLVINRRGLFHIDRWRRRGSSPVDHWRLRLGDSCTDSSANGKAAESAQRHGGTRGQAITRCSRLSGSQAGHQRQSRSCPGNKTEDPHDHHLNGREATYLPLHLMRYTVQNLSES
jgi:hypothetical protein